MKWLVLLVFSALSLQAGFFGSDSDEHHEQVQKLDLVRQFRENAADANAIVKRGEYTLIEKQERELKRIQQEVQTVNISDDARQKLLSDLKTYGQMVQHIGGKLKQSAPKLNQQYNYIIGGVTSFNKRLGSIGLSQLLHEWRELSYTKDRFVKDPDGKLVKTFDHKWTNVNVLITELYLDDFMETPLLDYLKAYKAYFKDLDDAYRNVGYAEVQKLKPLTYKIKLQLQMLAPEIAVANQ